MRRRVVIWTLFFLLPWAVKAQGNLREEYGRFRQQAISSYAGFREQCNKDYVSFLQQAWEYYRTGAVVEKPADETPPIIMDGEQEPVPVEDHELPFDEVIPVPQEEPQPQPVEPVSPLPLVQEEYCEFVFFGTPLKVRAGGRNRFTLKSTDGKDVAKAWEKLSGKDYDPMLADCLRIRADYKLCDWAYLQMLQTFAEAFIPSPDEATLLTAYLFSQSGYKMRLGVADKHLCLLFGTNHQIYMRPGFYIDHTIYYPLKGEAETIQVANFTFPNEKELSLVLADEPLFQRDESEPRQFSAMGYKTRSACSVNKNLLVFFNRYPSSQLDGNPMTRWAIYANTPLDRGVKEQLYPPLAEAVAGKGEPEAVSILLDFVQTAFAYEYDNAVWGEDRAFFAEESLYYPYCDCEDRAILFSRLVRDLLGLGVILVYYPGHMAAAVKFEESPAGDIITLNGERYLVCDPTYIGAPIGVTMPGMDNQMAKVILLQ